jgi:hypothetical protein
MTQIACSSESSHLSSKLHGFTFRNAVHFIATIVQSKTLTQSIPIMHTIHIWPLFIIWFIQRCYQCPGLRIVWYKMIIEYCGRRSCCWSAGCKGKPRRPRFGNGTSLIIAKQSSALRQAHSLFQSEFTKHCDPVFPASNSRNFSFLQSHPLAVYVFFFVFPFLLSFLQLRVLERRRDLSS